MKKRVARGIFAIVFLMTEVTTGFPQGRPAIASSRPSESLMAYLRTYLSNDKALPDTTTRITSYSVSIGDGKVEEGIVYVSGRGWCGSGGCTMLILESADSTFKVLGNVTIVQLPIRLLTSTSHGYPEIGVRVQGGGIQPDYEAVLSFNGDSYPRNPSMPPATKATAVQGKVIIANTENSVPLYN